MKHTRYAPLRTARAAGLLVAVCLLAGCQTAFVSSLSKLHPAADAIDSADRAQFAEDLSKDAWVADPEWTLLRDRPRSAHSPPERRDDARRWRYKNAPVAERLAKDDASADKLLEELSRRDSLAGWNAAILWAQRDPIAARSVSKVLAALVSDAPRYDQRSGSRVDVDEDRSARRDEQDVRGQSPSAQTDRSTTPTRSALSQGLIQPKSKHQQSQTSGDASDHSTWDELRELLPDWQRKKSQDPEATADAQHARGISPAMQAAAAEAWCRVLRLQGENSTPAQALAPAGDVLKSKRELPEEVRSALFIAIASDIQPLWIPTLPEAFDDSPPEANKESRSVELRRAAIGACLVHARHIAAEAAGHRNYDETLWPELIASCRRDSDPIVRRLYGRWAAWAGHAEVHATLLRQMDDADVKVRDDALISLGVCGTDWAKNELHERTRHPGALIRAAAVRGLSFWGAREIGPLRTDSSHHVRRIVAEELAQHPDVMSAVLLKELVFDSNATVQRAAVAAVDDWPDALAVPILLAGLTDGFLPIRKDCWQELEQRTHVDGQFAYDDPNRDHRAEQVLALARRHDWPLTLADSAQADGLAARDGDDSARAAEVAELVRTLVRSPGESPAAKDALAKLRKSDAGDVRFIEQAISRETPGKQSDAILRDVLPGISPVHAALADLESPEPLNRREAAQRLRQLANESSLGKLAMERLHARLPAENDISVWRDVVYAILPDASDSAAAVAQLAVNHPEPEIRTLGCQYLARHGRPAHAEWLRSLLTDPEREVRLAAIAAIGKCGNADLIAEGYVDGRARPLPGLRTLLTNADPRLRDAALASLAQLGDEAALRELERRSASPDWRQRVWAVEQLGATARPELSGALLHLASQESDPRVRRSLAASLAQVTPVDKHPAGLKSAAGDEAKLELWLEAGDLRAASESPVDRVGGVQSAGHSPVPAENERL